METEEVRENRKRTAEEELHKDELIHDLKRQMRENTENRVTNPAHAETRFSKLVALMQSLMREISKELDDDAKLRIMDTIRAATIHNDAQEKKIGSLQKQIIAYRLKTSRSNGNAKHSR